MDVATFLTQRPPFDELTPDEVAALVAATDIVFYLRGETIFEAGEDIVRHVWIVRRGAIDLLDGSEVVDQAAEGEMVGAVAFLAGERPLLTARAHEETLAYRIEGAAAARALSTLGGIGFLGRSLRRRERTLLAHVDAAAADPWVVPLSEVSSSDVLVVDGTVPIREAARAMGDGGVSSALVRTADGWAIVTDRDLRVRVLASGIDPDVMVETVASSPLASLPADATAAEALGLMLERGIHHVPVTEAGEVLGIVTDTDLMALERRSVLRQRREIARAPSVEDVIEVTARVPATLADLVAASMDPLSVAHLAGVLRDTATIRLLELEVARLGPAPATWAWMALGSQARYEQGIETDQDHAMVIGAAADDESGRYFGDLGEAVTTSLARAGIPRCKAGVIAANPEWRGTQADWGSRFSSWSKDPDPWAFGRAAIALDHRMLTGPLDPGGAFITPLRAMGADPMVQRRLARWVVEQRVPRGFLRAAIVEGRGTHDVVFDVKRQGIAIISSLARVVGLQAGVHDNRTGARLRAGAAAGMIAAEDASALEDAFRLLWQVRFDHQSAQVRRGSMPDDQVDPRSLGPLTRQALKEAFRQIEAAQQVLSLEMGLR